MKEISAPIPFPEGGACQQAGYDINVIQEKDPGRQIPLHFSAWAASQHEF